MGRDLSLLFAVGVSVLAVGLRLREPCEWPTPFHPTVQYESALAARAAWCTADPRARTADRAAWFDAVGYSHVVSPPVLPTLVAGVYAVVGEEVPWASKPFAAAFWVAAGWMVRAAALRTTGARWAATAALAWFVLTPFGVTVSRSFQTEPVLALAVAAGVWLLARLDRPGWRATLLAGVGCGVVGLAKPGVAFLPLAAGFAGVLATAPVAGRTAKLAAFAALAALPSLAYAGCVLHGHVGSKVLPELLAEGWFYTSVEKQVARVVGYGALGLAGGGVAAAAVRRAWLVPGLFVGYAGYAAVFTYHCATHDYYHVPLMVLVAVALAGPLSRLEPRPVNDGRALAVAITVLGVYLAGLWVWSSGPSGAFDARPAVADEIKAVVGPGAGVIVLGDAFGYPLEYHAGVRRACWPCRSDVPVLTRTGLLPSPFEAGEYLRELVTRRGFDYFVVTDTRALDDQPALEAALAAVATPSAGPGWRVYDLRRLRDGFTP